MVLASVMYQFFQDGSLMASSIKMPPEWCQRPNFRCRRITLPALRL
jgi:hypothetical protein